MAKSHLVALDSDPDSDPDLDSVTEQPIPIEGSVGTTDYFTIHATQVGKERKMLDTWLRGRATQ